MHFQIHVDRSANLAALMVRVERDPAASRSAEDLVAALTGHIKDNIGVSVEVVVTEPGGVPRSAGKAQRVVST
jgi:phenylacetate-CoA ligase